MKNPDCHPMRSYGARGMCKICYNKWLRKTNPDYDKKCKEICLKIGRTPKAKATKENLMLLKRYGITTEEKYMMMKEQNYKCKLCNKLKELIVEHNHETKKVRGLTCEKCNILISNLENNKELLIPAFRYLNMFVNITINEDNAEVTATNKEK